MKTIRVKVPATTANLGPGFDALGLALDLWNEAEFSFRDEGQVGVKVHGEGEGKLPTNAENAVSKAALQLFELANQTNYGIQINCLNRIPLGSGLGSSSAATLTGMLGANALLDNPFSDKEILQFAIENEGHPDNVAPAMLGGLVVSTPHEGSFLSVDLPVMPIQATVVLPDFDLPTKEARAVLPKEVAFSDAIANLSYVSLVTEAFRRGDLDLLGKAMKDKLHQPYRLPLIPGAQAALEAAQKAGAAAALSGAGPSVVAFSADRDPLIREAMLMAFADAGLEARVFELGISQNGAEVKTGLIDN
ncbi:MAG: homoserine kinase [Chloroflexota bacterium]